MQCLVNHSRAVASLCSRTVKTLPNERRVLRMRATIRSDRVSDAADESRASLLTPVDVPLFSLAEGSLQMMDFASWIGTQLRRPVSVDPDVREKVIFVAAAITNADAFVIQELISANGCFLERNDDNGLRIRATPTDTLR